MQMAVTAAVIVLAGVFCLQDAWCTAGGSHVCSNVCLEKVIAPRTFPFFF